MITPYSTLIIDDEPPARKGLQNLLGHFPETFKVVGLAENGTEAKEKIAQLKPDVLFLDIEMPGLSGFELLQQLEHIPIVIFCTAYDQYALKAFDTNCVDYLVKPIQIERLQQTVNKLKLFKNNNQWPQDLLKTLQDISKQKEIKHMTSITVKKDNKLIFVKLEDVSHFKADERYVTVYSKKGLFLTDESLSQLEQKLPGQFLRVHRGIIINTNHVLEVQKYFNNRFTITLNDNTRTSITSSRGYKQQITEWMGV